MNTRFAWVLAAAVLAGCSNDWSAGLELAEDGRQQVAATVPGVASSSPVNGVRPIGFASAPDRGDLLQYPAAPVVRRTGAYTWHATRLSEEHAMAAVVSGRMRVTAPDGTPIALDYTRHVEHPDGNWSWIGRNPDAPGQDAVITFGPEAVFGSVPQGNDLPPLRLTMADGAGWVVSADPRQLADIRNSATHPDGPDYLVPPKLTSASGASSGMAMAGAQPQAVTASATTTVDVLVGYTNGFASELGGSSAAATRVHNLVDITNQAYANSQVDAKLRLVHSMQVTYPDATDNGTALEELTGFKAPSTQTTPAPAFNALRAARDQYGADLVVLVRQFKDPENDGCGVAWLIGGGQSGINESDEFFGYSVVSDGQDQGTDGKTYFCREETFAHEVGHNMGSQHDEATAGDSYGAYAYSFGYKTGSAAGNFYTVMAYGDSGQTSYRVFSNPSVTLCGGRACGVSNQADNARSLRQTASTIASFRAASAPPEATVQTFGAYDFPTDFNGDGRADIVWRDVSTGQNTIWLSASKSTRQAMKAISLQAWKMARAGDFNGDGKDDLLWRNDTSGANAIWLSGNYATQQPTATVPDLGWQIVGSGDFNADARADVLWRHMDSGANTIWLSGRSGTQQPLKTIADTRWEVAATGDFGGDGRTDILWRHALTGENLLWHAGSQSQTQWLRRIPDLKWQVVGAGDFNRDGRSDILWRHAVTGALLVWPAADQSASYNLTRIADLNWMVVGVADFTGDGRADILWRHMQTGENLYWRSGAHASSQWLSPVGDSNWRVFGRP